MASYGQAQELKSDLSEQMQALRNEVESQGAALGVLTVVGALFLPLIFFSQASTAFTDILTLVLMEISLRSISHRATTMKETALLALL